MAFLFLIGLGVLLAIGLIVASFKVDQDENLPKILRFSAAGLLALSGIVTLATSATSVSTGHIGLVYSFGAITSQRSEGLQWVAPWQSIKEVSVQTQGHKFEKMTAFSKETQSITVTATVNAKANSVGIQELYRTTGDKYFDILIHPRVLQAFKDECVKYSSIDIAPKREVIREHVRATLAEEMLERGIIIEDLLIDDISFGELFEKAIEEKQRQTQLALAEEIKVGTTKSMALQKIEQAKGEAESTLILANTQAQANKTLSESLTSEYIQYLYVSKLSPNVKVMMLPAGQGLFLNSAALDGEK